jgi:hypothetical protein
MEASMPTSGENLERKLVAAIGDTMERVLSEEQRDGIALQIAIGALLTRLAAMAQYVPRICDPKVRQSFVGYIAADLKTRIEALFDNA